MAVFWRRLLLGLFLVILAFVLPLSLSQRLRDWTARATSPLDRILVRWESRTSSFLISIRQINSLRANNQTLEEQVFSLQQQLADQNTIKEENAALRQEVGVTGIMKPIPKAFAHIILKGSDVLDQTFTVDIGTDLGVKINQPVVVQGRLIGKVISAGSHSAVIRGLTSHSSIVQAWLVDSKEKGLLIGDGNNIYLTQITQGVKMAPDSVVETSGLGGSLPQGLLIGSLGGIQSKPSDPTQSFLVKTGVDYGQLETVFILLTDPS